MSVNGGDAHVRQTIHPGEDSFGCEDLGLWCRVFLGERSHLRVLPA